MDDEEVLATRRDFLKIAALGAIGSLSLPGCSSSSAESSVPSAVAITPARTVYIIAVVDVAQALADESLQNNVYIVDNNKAAGSQSQGTARLETAVNKGDNIVWLVSGLEVETVVDIASITGPAATIANATIIPGALASYFVGQIAPTASGSYQYNVALMVENRLMTIPSSLTLDVL